MTTLERHWQVDKFQLKRAKYLIKFDLNSEAAWSASRDNHQNHQREYSSDSLGGKSPFPSRVELIGDFKGIWSLCLNV